MTLESKLFIYYPQLLVRVPVRVCVFVCAHSCVFGTVRKSHYIHACLSAHVLVISSGLYDITLLSRVYSWQSAQVLVAFSDLTFL